MTRSGRKVLEKRQDAGIRWRTVWFLAVGSLIIPLIMRLAPRSGDKGIHEVIANGATKPGNLRLASPSAKTPVALGVWTKAAAATPEQIIGNKVSQFARDRRNIARAMARRFKVAMPAEAERFFEAATANRWEEVKELFEAMSQQRSQAPDGNEDLAVLWPAIMETYGVALTAHEWPAQKVLDYGQAILGSLRPGMVYVGGTDPGRFIPTLLNETSSDEGHVILTQNGLADASYLNYLSFLYSNRLATLTAEDSQRAFQEYLEDAKKRAAHDQQFPDEPKQLRPAEDVQMVENRVRVSGQVAVMAINEKLFQFLMEKNPETSFAMEQSYPLTSTYAKASTLGPIMELRVTDEQDALSLQRVDQAIDYWRNVTQTLLADTESANAPDVRITYAKMAAEQAALFLDRSYPAQAEQALRLASELWPASPDAVFRYVNLLLAQNRLSDAVLVAENGLKAAPDYEQFQDLTQRLRRMGTAGITGN